MQGLLSAITIASFLLGVSAQDPRAINPNGNRTKCLDVREGRVADGTPVQIYDCNGTPAQQWSMSRGSTEIRLSNTKYCLDATLDWQVGKKMTIWTCNGQPQQKWNWSSDNRIALENKGLCLDLTGGHLTNGNVVQTWSCVAGEKNQVWTR